MNESEISMIKGLQSKEHILFETLQFLVLEGNRFEIGTVRTKQHN